MKPIKIIKKNKKGSVVDLLIWVVVAFVVTVFFGLWVYGFGQMESTLMSIPNATGMINISISDATAKTFSIIEPAQETGLHVLAYTIIFILAISILITNFLEKTNPAFFVLYIFVLLGAIIASVYVSNEYESLMTNAILGSTFQDFTGASFILLYLPVWVTVIGFIGAILLFAGILRDRGLGGGVT